MDWTGSGPLSFIIRKYPLQMFIYRQSSVKIPIKNFKQNYLSFLPDKFWTEDECLYKSDNGDLVIVKLVGKNLSVIVSNVYAPNDHNEEFFDHLKQSKSS